MYCIEWSGKLKIDCQLSWYDLYKVTLNIYSDTLYVYTWCTAILERAELSIPCTVHVELVTQQTRSIFITLYCNFNLSFLFLSLPILWINRVSLLHLNLHFHCIFLHECTPITFVSFSIIYFLLSFTTISLYIFTCTKCNNFIIYSLQW